MNLFRQGKQLLNKKDNGDELTKDKQELINTAIIPLMLLPEYNDTPIAEGLEELARLVEEATLVVSRRRVVVNSPAS